MKKSTSSPGHTFPPRTEFAERLKAARVAARMTQEEAADVLHVARRAIQQWEGGLREPIYPAQLGTLAILKAKTPSK